MYHAGARVGPDRGLSANVYGHANVESLQRLYNKSMSSQVKPLIQTRRLHSIFREKRKFIEKKCSVLLFPLTHMIVCVSVSYRNM